MQNSNFLPQSSGPDRDHIKSTLRKIELMERTKWSVAKHRRSLPHPRAVAPDHCEKLTKQKAALKQLFKSISLSQKRLSIDLDQRIATSLAPECRVICDRIERHLPRELRDMIYQYLISQSGALIEETDFSLLTSPESSRPKLFDNSHLLEPGYCNEIMRREVFEAWYKFTTFQFATNSAVHKFLSKDLWNINLPVRQLVRNIEIDIWPSGCMFDSDLEVCSTEAAFLSCLTTLKKGAKIMFPIGTSSHEKIWCSDELQIQKFLQILSGVFPLAKKLLDVGHEVTIEVDTDLVVQVTPEDLSKTVWYQKIKDKKREMAAMSDQR